MSTACGAGLVVKKMTQYGMLNKDSERNHKNQPKLGNSNVSRPISDFMKT
jgi:hypothetical protein